MKIDRKALLLAPLPFPALCSLLFVATTSGGNPLMGFLILFAIGAAIAYLATLGLLLPALALATRLTAMNAAKAAILGDALGLILFLPLEWIMWRASGADSGPPADTFLAHLLRDLGDPVMLIFPIGGITTAVLYWALSSRADGN